MELTLEIKVKHRMSEGDHYKGRSEKSWNFPGYFSFFVGEGVHYYLRVVKQSLFEKTILEKIT